MNQIFSPFFYHYPVDSKVQPHIHKSVTDYREMLSNSVGLPQEPASWGCSVETSFAYGEQDDSNPDQDAMNLRSVFAPYIAHARDSLGIPDLPYAFISWYNAYTGSQFQERHDHIGAQLSGVYFVQYDPKVHSQFSFVNPFNSLLEASYPKMMDSPRTDNSLFMREFSPQVEQGSLIIFPSFMEHKVNRSFEEYTTPRITFSFNIRFSNWY